MLRTPRLDSHRRMRWLAAFFCLATGLMIGSICFADSHEAAESAPDVAAEAAEAVAQAEEGAAEDAQDTVSDEMFTVNNLWVALAGCLVFIMHLGFATLESGLTRSKNTVNILFKNTMIICIGLLMYGLLGFNLMYPGDFNGYLGFAGFGLGAGYEQDANTIAYASGNYTYWTDFFFQAMFAATAATIVSGAVAERIKLMPFLIFTALFVGISYNVTGSWKWGGGWLDSLGFYDFAGSTIVHSVGGWGALVGAIMLGPRIGKYASDGSTNPIPGHNLPLATVGVLLLWFGWFGFNGGSVLSADAASVSLVLVTTSMAAAAGGVAAALTSWCVSKKPDLSMALNGILAGLVGITAGADQMPVWAAVVIGAVAGVIVVFSVFFFDRIKIDDPVGAISVHLVCGIWGTLAVGIFGAKAGMSQVGYQLVGIVSIGVFTLVFAGIVFGVLKAAGALRVSATEEIEGLDLGEHNMASYPDFQRTFIKSYEAGEM